MKQSSLGRVLSKEPEFWRWPTATAAVLRWFFRKGDSVRFVSVAQKADIVQCVHRLNSSSEFAYISENIIVIQDSIDYLLKNLQLCFCLKILRYQCFRVHHSNYEWFTPTLSLY
jgi:hypothetical protein